MNERTAVPMSAHLHANRAGRLLAAVALLAAVLGLSTALSAAPAAAQPAPSATVCQHTDLGAPCQTFSGDAPDLRGTTLGDDTASSLHVEPGSYLTLYRDLNFTGVCQQFIADNRYLLGSVVGNDQATSLRVTSTPTDCPVPAPGTATVCRDSVFTGVCQTFSQDVPDLRGTTVGDDTITSLTVDADTYLVLYADPNYQGQCQEFGPLTLNGLLIGSIIGDDTTTSLKVRGNPGNCNNGTDVAITTGQRVINHMASYTLGYDCPQSYPYQHGFWNNSSPNVTAVVLGSSSTHLSIGFTNWNITGDQTAGVRLHCSTIPG